MSFLKNKKNKNSFGGREDEKRKDYEEKNEEKLTRTMASLRVRCVGVRYLRYDGFAFFFFSFFRFVCFLRGI